MSSATRCKKAHLHSTLHSLGISSTEKKHQCQGSVSELATCSNSSPQHCPHQHQNLHNGEAVTGPKQYDWKEWNNTAHPPLGKLAVTLFLMRNIAEIKIRQYRSPSSLSFTPGAKLQDNRDLSTGQKLKSQQPRALAFQKDSTSSLTGSSPVVQDAVDHHPLGLDAIAVEPLLHLGILGVLVLPLLPLAVLVPRAVVKGWWLIHVVLPLVVAVHDGVVELQLQQEGATLSPWAVGQRGKERALPMPRGLTCSSLTQEQCQ